MTDLHQRLLAQVDAYDCTDPRCTPRPGDQRCTRHALAAALRAVVELHAPIEQGFAASHWLDCRGCDSRDEPPDSPCSTVQAIARELGVQEDDHHG